MNQSLDTACTAFAGFQRIASGSLPRVAIAVKKAIGDGECAAIHIFDDATSQPIEIDFRGSLADFKKRLANAGNRSTRADALIDADADAQAPRGPGRPKLGVVAREVTLLPRHWQWLQAQPGGASVALRKLVDDARRTHRGRDLVRTAQEVSYRFMAAIGGDLPDFEEATRALFAGNRQRFTQMIAAWPVDVRTHAAQLAADAFAD